MRKRALTVTALLFLLSSTLVLVDHQPIEAEESQLVRIFGGVATGAGEMKKPIRLEPPTMTISEGGVVVWLNWARSTRSR